MSQITLSSQLLHHQQQWLQIPPQPSLSSLSLLKNLSYSYIPPNSLLFPRKYHSSSEGRCLGFRIPIDDSVSRLRSSRLLLVSRCVSEKFSDSFESDQFSNPVLPYPTQLSPLSSQLLGLSTGIRLDDQLNDLSDDRCFNWHAQIQAIWIHKRKEASFVKILKGANSILPQVVIASTVLALLYPPSFTWFTSRYYAPALGFLMFAVGVNSSEKDFLEAFKRPAAILAGYIGQFVVKPLLGYVFGTVSMTIFGLPTSLGAGIMLTSCVSGAQLSNYATFLTDPSMAPLSIVMTSLSTATAVLVTPILSLLLIGKRLPVDVKGMVSSILQIVVAPIASGLLLNRFFPRICNAIRPFLPPLSVFVTALCVGAPLAINIDSVLSPFGASVLFLVIAFHLSAFIAGYSLTGLVFHDAPDAKALQRTLSYETGMQSSLLALALANRFFQDPLVGVPPAISVVIMSLMGFSLVMLWAKKKN